MNDLDAQYRVRPSFSIVAHSPDVVELRRGVWNPVSITLTDKSGSGKLFGALEAMTGDATLREVARRTGMSDDEMQSLAAFLSRHDAIETEPQSVFDLQLQLYRDTLAGGMGGMKFSRVHHLGAAELTSAMGDQLGELDDRLEWTAVSEDLAAELAAADYTQQEDPLALRKRLAAYEGWKDSLLVVASLTVNPILLANINRVCLFHGIPWVHAAADGPFLIVGPTFVPKKSACYECFESRVAMSMRESASYLRYKQALARRAVKLGKPYLGRPFAGLLAALTALEVANVAATGSNFTAGKALTVFLPTLGFSYNEVLRVPGCRACSPVTEQHEQGLYFDLKGYVNSIYEESRNGAGPGAG